MRPLHGAPGAPTGDVVRSAAAPAREVVHPAVRRAAATVALDLRRSGQVAAVAVDGRGAAVAWAVLGGGGDRAAVARRGLRALRVRPREVRVLLGAAAEVAAMGVQVTLVTPAGAGGAVAVGGGAGVSAATGGAAAGIAAEEIAAALYAEGCERLRAPAVAALAVAADSWLAAACEGEELASLADGLLADSGGEPLFVVDQQLALAGLAAGGALIEHGEGGLLVAWRPAAGGPLGVRSLPRALDVEEAARECRASLAAAEVGAVEVCGAGAAALARRLAADGEVRRLAADDEARRLAADGEARVSAPEADAAESGPPAVCAMARRLAACRRGELPPVLASPALARRQASLAWARRAARAGVAAAAVGLVLAAVGLRLGWAGRAGGPALRARVAANARLAAELRQLAALAGEVGREQSAAAGKTPPWPRLAAAVADLARRLPADAGWQRLEVRDGVLELAAAAGGAAPEASLARLRAELERAPDLVNLAWAAPSRAPAGARWRQTFHATVRERTAGARQGAP